MIKAIQKRTSIRHFKSEPLAKDDIEDIIKSGMYAPSSHNKQPWKFYVMQGKSKNKLVDIYETKIMSVKNPNVFLIGTLEAMRQAPVIILIYNRLGKDVESSLDLEERFEEVCNVQSIGACIENMCIEATSKDIGSLWICDIFRAYKEIHNYMLKDGQIIAALALGYSRENYMTKNRLPFDEVVEWYN